jgi:diguanylate cyclase (GGDEF)-like protein/PAS domain S-box-containing protein
MNISMNDELFRKVIDNLYEGVYFIDRSKRITYWNLAAEKITGYSSSEVLGVHCKEDILVYSKDEVVNLCKGQCPLVETLSDGRMRETQVFIQHKDGHKVSVIMRAIQVRDANGEMEGVLEIFTDNTPKLMHTEKMGDLEKVALIDILTGLANKKYLETAITARLGEMQRYGWQFGIISLDMDNYRMVNELYGREVGEKALKVIAKTLVNSSRPFDMIGRWENEHFIAVIANVNENTLSTVANRFLALVEQSNLTIGSKIIRITLSVGATLARPGDSVAAIVERAALLMKKSHDLGGNRLTVKPD